MEFFCYHRDRPGSAALRDELLERHWSYMDQYEAELIARGPTLADDGDTPTGSVHIVDLPDAAAARAFAFDEPNYQAGIYRDVLLRRWRNILGRTMWDFPGGPEIGRRYRTPSTDPAHDPAPALGRELGDQVEEPCSLATSRSCSVIGHDPQPAHRVARRTRSRTGPARPGPARPPGSSSSSTAS